MGRESAQKNEHAGRMGGENDNNADLGEGGMVHGTVIDSLLD